jgi:membrane-bound lytic murein transglycosylase A
MIAQDTGSAIVGPARADLYFGAGEDAGRVAGRIRNLGKFTMLVPRELDPVEAGTHLPLPPDKPPLPTVTQRTDKGKKKTKLEANPEPGDEPSPEQGSEPSNGSSHEPHHAR